MNMNMRMKQCSKAVGYLAVMLACAASTQAQDGWGGWGGGDGWGFNTNLPSVAIFATDPTALEGTSSGAFTLIRYGSTSNAITVDLTISGSASNGVDYATISSTVVIPAGGLAVDIAINPLVVNTGNKTVELTVDTNAAYNVFRRHAAVEIIDDTFDIPKPTVTLVSPTNGSVYGFPTNITLLATASDPDVTITSVSFYANDDFLGKVTNSPYTLTWSNAYPGHIAVFARAVDSVGQSTFSAPSHITVTNSSGTNFGRMFIASPTAQ